MRAIADGTVISLRKSSDKRDLAPFNINADKPNTKGSNDGYVLIKHETEIGSGDEGKVAFYSGNDSNLLVVFYVQIMSNDFVMQFSLQA